MVDWQRYLQPIDHDHEKLLFGLRSSLSRLIHAYDPFSGKPLGALLDEHGMPIQIDDLWALKFGTDTTGGEHTLLFSAGIMDEMHGLVGSINHVR